MSPELLRLTVLTLATALALLAIFSIVSRIIARRSPNLAGIVINLAYFLLPLGAVIFYLSSVLHYNPDGTTLKILQTIFWIGLVWILSGIVQVMVVSRSGVIWGHSHVPRLFVDIARIVIMVLALGLVLTSVWHHDLTDFLATLGIGSIVLGLALQDTLGNLMAGIALVFERPFEVGHWIKVGDTIGQVMEMNWRAVRVKTRSLDTVVVPNSVLGKERIHNFSSPTTTHGIEVVVGFSYEDPPNKVKRILMKAILETRGVLRDHNNVIRTVGYGDSSISYQVRFFISDYSRLPDIQEEFMTHLWYAANRHGLTFPFPIRTVYKTEIPPRVKPDQRSHVVEALRKVHVFNPLNDSEIELLAQDAHIEGYAKDERILEQGTIGDTLCVILSGEVLVSVVSGAEVEQQVSTLHTGEFFGEMSLLTGERRSANITASEDCKIVVITKDSFGSLLKNRPDLAEQVAEIVESRRQGLTAARQVTNLPSKKQEEVKKSVQSLVNTIKQYFRIFG